MPSFVLRPNIKKAYIASIIKVLAAVGIIVLIITIFNVFLKGEISGIFEFLGISISPKVIFLYFIFAIIVVSLIILVLNYVTLSNARYEFLGDKLVLYASTFLVMLSSEEIAYDNIISASYSQSFFDKLLNTGTIVISLRGLAKQTANLELVDNAVIYTNNINSLLDNYRAIKQSQMESGIRINNLLGREVY